MKRLLILLIFSIAICSCEKDYNCLIQTSYMGVTDSTYHTFTGTKKEMKEFEASAWASQTIECE